METSTPSRPARFISRQEREAHYASVFAAVKAQYMLVVSFPRIAAMRIDRDAPPPRRLTLDDIAFKVDTEKATERALQGRKDLEPIWFQLAGETEADPAAAAETIQLCGKICAARRLSPHEYYKVDKYPKRAVQR